MAILFALIALAAIVGLLAISISRPDASQHQESHQQKPAAADKRASTPTEDDAKQQSEDGPREHKGNNYWERFVASVEGNDKALVAIGTIVIAAFTVCLALATAFLFWSSEKVAEAAKESAEATKKAVELSDRTAERQLRAYLFPHQLTVGNVNVGQRPTANMLVKNTGLTPAVRTVAWAGITVERYPLPVDRELKRATAEFMTTASRRTVGPGAEFNIIISWEELLTEPQRALLEAGKAAVYVWGEVTYVDIFGHERTTSFRSYYGGDMGLIPGGNTVTTPDGNDAN